MYITNNMLNRIKLNALKKGACLVSKPCVVGKSSFHYNLHHFSKTNLLICYGSQTGTAQMFAEGLKSELVEKNPSFLSSVKVVDLSDIEPERAMSFAMQKNDLYNIVLFIMSNYGEGQPTDNAKGFFEWLMSDNSKSLDFKQNSANYAIFGLGNSANFPERYQAVGKKMEQRLKDLGCQLSVKRGEGDDGGDEGIETDFENWKNEFITFLKEQESETSKAESCQAPSQESAELAEGVTTNGKHFFRLLDKQKYKDKLREFVRLYDSSSPISPKNPFPLRVKSVKNLCPESERKRLEIEFDIENTPIEYETGDHISIFPINPHSLVKRLEKRLGLDIPMEDLIFTLETPPCSIELPPFVSTKENPISLYQAISQFFDLNGVTSPSLLGFLAEKATDPTEKSALESMKSEKYLTDVKNRLLNIVDILEAFPSVKVTWQDLIGVLPKNQPRYYSISSSKLENEERAKRGEGRILRVTYSPLVQPVDGNKTFFGLCSNYLSGCNANMSKCPSVIRTSSFRLPENPLTPLVCIAGGTGIAPFRGFIDERRIQKMRNPSIKFGPSILFYGVRCAEEVIYKKELEQAVKDGLISEFHVAYSGTNRKMIADAIYENKEKVYEILNQSKGNLYLCGGVSGFGTRAYNVLKSIIKEIEHVDDSVADTRIDMMRKEGRCFEDLSD